ncbi:MAG: hypothetical protein KGO49_05375 [Gammaproteobacteria bacterium]|nr:hypothetical protein [Gammaproteobacteria bacterium]
MDCGNGLFMKGMDTTRFLIGLILVLILPNTYAETFSSTNEDALASARLRAKTLNLAHSQYWQRLMFYRKDDQGVKSAVTQSSFFLAQDGQTNPEAELDATLRGLFSPNIAHPD